MRLKFFLHFLLPEIMGKKRYRKILVWSRIQVLQRKEEILMGFQGRGVSNLHQP